MVTLQSCAVDGVGNVGNGIVRQLRIYPVCYNHSNAPACWSHPGLTPEDESDAAEAYHPAYLRVLWS
jgi:hypothetical protein